MLSTKKNSPLRLIQPPLLEAEFKHSKADALKFAGEHIEQGYVLPMICFNYAQWMQSGTDILSDLSGFYPEAKHIVRSSCQREDKPGKSMAGYFESVLNVENQTDSLKKAIDDVFASYGDITQSDQVFVQPQLQNVKISGVLFTQEPNNGSPYYVINYDDTSSNTESITSGTCTTAKTDYIVHQLDQITGWQNQLINCAKEIIALFNITALDIEFAVDVQGAICIFQVRPLKINEYVNLERDNQSIELNCIHKKVFRLAQPHPYLLGKKSLFGVMPDWNPAEIIGIRPKPLALSLYKELITDKIWSHQRSNYGYRNVNGFPLLVVLGGTPFIDVRLSFNSFVPAELNLSIAEKLVNFYLDKLQQNPQLHDKIEFDIVFSSYSFDLPQRLNELDSAGFTKMEIASIQQNLLDLTNNILSENTNVWQRDIESIETLQNRQQQIKNSNLNKIEKIHWLIEDCKNYGTLPFAGLARVGFIAVQLLESLVTIGAITRIDAQSFLSSVNTISSTMLSDFRQLEKKPFLKKYGHLRPGTYDILSSRYDEDPDKYFNWSKRSETSDNEQISFPISLDKLNLINGLLTEHGLKIEAIGLFNFIKKAIEARELGKFVFTESLSDCLVIIEQLGQSLDVSKESMAFADIRDLLKLYSTSFSANALVQSSVKLGMENYQLAKSINLPPLIRTPNEVLHFSLMDDQPNFITQHSISAEVAEGNIFNNQSMLIDKILFIESADPGYDWIFSQGIGGFVTKYGGCNSHMAIRAGELNIPAVIGAGELLYDKWNKAKALRIDCANKKVDIIK